MSTITLVLQEQLYGELCALAENNLETAGVLLVGIARSPDGEVRLLGRKFIPVPSSAYIRREKISLSIASDGYVPALAEAESTGSVALWVHTHPGQEGIPLPSEHDHIVDTEITELFRIRSGAPYYGAFIVSPRDGGIAFSGHLDSEDLQSPISRLWIVGERLRLLTSFDYEASALSPSFDRNIRAFGGAIQRALTSIRVAVIGCGGTGSAVAEQLVRLGVRHLQLVDPDTLSPSNVTRVYGSTPELVGRPKAEILAGHLRSIAPDLSVTSTIGTVLAESVARSLISSDIIFGCTDDNAGRLVLSRISSYLLTPVIDCGVLLSANASGELIGIDGRVTTLVPGQACLVCRDRIDTARAAAELLTKDEYAAREREGYAPALGTVEPAVVTFTTAVAATAVNELLERLIGFGPSPTPSEILLRFHERELSTNVAKPRERHYCNPDSGKLGAGESEPFLDQLWRS